MKRWLVILISIIALLIPGPVKAQSASPLIEKMEIEILPEYDRPDVLVIYHISLAPQVNLPAQLEIRVPKEAAQPYNVAMKDVDGLLYNLDNSTEIRGDWLVISLTTPLPDLQIEYYDPRINHQNGRREIEYTWPEGLNVNNLSLTVYQPLNATNLITDPDMGSGRKTASDLTRYDLVLGKMTAETSFRLKIAYDKPDDILSGPSQPVVASAPINEKTAGWVTLQEMLPWILGGLGLLLIGGGGYWYWRSGREFYTPTFRRLHELAHPDEATRPLGGGVFCHKCGRKAAPGDVFCRTCGTKLRAE